MTGKRLRAFVPAAWIFLLCALFPARGGAETVTDPQFGYSLDLPEGFSLAGSTEDGMSCLFTHDRVPVQLALRLYPQAVYADAEAALSGALEKLSAQGDIDRLEWRGTPCAVAVFSVRLPGADAPSRGWAEAVSLPGKETQLVLLCYADSDREHDLEQFIVSVLNSLAIDRESLHCPGILTAYAFPPEGAQDVTVRIGGREIRTELDKSDIRAAEFVVECEFAVLSLYADSASWREAWQRYYRLIFRDSFGRLGKAAADLFDALYPAARRENPQNPEAALLRTLLAWAQNFSYERRKTKSDFTSLPAALAGAGSDCDSRSLLLCALLENMGVKSALFVSREYSHAVCGFDIDAAGAKISAGGRDYLLCETTAKGVAPGLIAQDRSDTSKWIPVLLP